MYLVIDQRIYILDFHTALPEKIRQNAENKQTLIFSGKIDIELREKLVKTLKINKL